VIGAIALKFVVETKGCSVRGRDIPGVLSRTGRFARVGDTPARDLVGASAGREAV